VPTNSLFVACRADSIAPAKRPRRAARAVCCGCRRASDGSARAAKKEGRTILNVMTREGVSRRRRRLAPGGAPEVHSERDAGRLTGVDKKNHLSYLDGAAAPRFRHARSRENRLEGVRRSPSVSRSLAHAPRTDASQSHADRPPPPP
jgi:hypothetical protein